MTIKRICSLLVLLSISPLTARASQPVSLIPCTKAVAIQELGEFSRRVQNYGAAPVNFTLDNVILVDQGESHPFYQFRGEHEQYVYDSCTGSIRYYRDDLNQPLTEEELKTQSLNWLGESEVKTRANTVKDVLLPHADLESFTLSDRLGRIAKTENGVKVSRFLWANRSIILYRARVGNVRGPAFLQLGIDRKSGLIQSIIYEDVNCRLDEAQVRDVIKEAKEKIADPTILSFVDQWGLCWPVLTKSNSDKIEFLDLKEGRLKPLEDITFASQHDSKSDCRLIHNGESLLPGDSLLFKPVVVNNAPLIYSAYFPFFEIQVTAKQHNLLLTGLLPKIGNALKITMGSHQAVIGDKTVSLSNPPQIIDGYLYLPYELLNLCNKILVRWEPSKNTLWIDTRNLRRGKDHP